MYFIGLAVWLVFLFSTLGISASDFFCPNLATISDVLGLDENVAGATFLALGNGSPDVFSTFSAMKAGSGSLAIGELIGAATFILSVVVGSMTLIKPFKVNRGPFLRDVGFFAAAIILLLAVLSDGVIHWWEAGLLVLLYVSYVLAVVVTSLYERRVERLRIKESLLREQYGLGDSEEDFPVTTPYRDDPEELHRDGASGFLNYPTFLKRTDTYYLAQSTLSVPTSPISPYRIRAHSNPTLPSPSTAYHHNRLSLSTHLTPQSRSRTTSHSTHRQNLPSYSLLGALEFRNAVNLLLQQSSTPIDIAAAPITPYAAGHYHNPVLSGHSPRRDSRADIGDETNPWDATVGGVPLDQRHSGEVFQDFTTLRPPSHHSHSRLPRPPSVAIDGADGTMHSSIPSPYASPVLEHPTRTTSKRQRAKQALFQTFHTLFPTLHDFTEKSLLGMIAALFAAPAVLVLTLTLPVVVTPMQDPEVEENMENIIAPTLGNLIDFEEEGVERALVAEGEVGEMSDLKFNKWLMAVQCICAPLFCVSVLFGTPRGLALCQLFTFCRDECRLPLASNRYRLGRGFRGCTSNHLCQ